jgi:peptide chain release factor 1
MLALALKRSRGLRWPRYEPRAPLRAGTVTALSSSPAVAATYRCDGPLRRSGLRLQHVRPLHTTSVIAAAAAATEAIESAEANAAIHALAPVGKFLARPGGKKDEGAALVWAMILHIGNTADAVEKAFSDSGAAMPPHHVRFKREFSRELSLAEELCPALRELVDAGGMHAEAVAQGDADVAEMALQECTALGEALRDGEAAQQLFAAVSERIRAEDVAAVTKEATTKWTLEVVGRAGGVEAGIFARELFELFKVYCGDVRRWEVTDVSEPDAHGGTLRLVGDDIFGYMLHEAGVHRVQRVPTTEANGRMQTSTASVMLMPMPSASSVDIRDEDVIIDMVRGSGPGGQGVNSSSNAVRLTHAPSKTTIKCHQSRSANANRDIAMDMLAQKLWKIAFLKDKKNADSALASQWTSGERGERMRTYNFPQNRIVDHRINWESSNVGGFMTGEGQMAELHAELRARHHSVNIVRVVGKVMDRISGQRHGTE